MLSDPPFPYVVERHSSRQIEIRPPFDCSQGKNATNGV